MAKILVIADDLTGALDTGVQFTRAGLSTLVTTGLPARVTPDEAAVETLVIDTESRHLPPAEAAVRVSEAAALGRRIGVTLYYKKIDSTLRGNLGAELAALVAAVPPGELMLAPAFPGRGRTVRDGRLYVNGLPLRQTDQAGDLLSPVESDRISSLIARQTDIPVQLVSGPAELPPRGGDSICLFDAGSDGDLAGIAARLAREGRLSLAAGSAGFAAAIAAWLNPTVFRETPVRGRLPMLVVNGSRNEISRRQIAHGASQGYRRLRIAPVDLDVDGSGPCGDRALRLAAEELRQGRNCLLEVSPGDFPYAAQVLAAGLGRLVRSIVELISPGCLVVFGGDTAYGILQALNLDRLTPLAEIEPGLVYSETSHARYRLPLITKAGGFGDDGLIPRIAGWLASPSRHP